MLYTGIILYHRKQKKRLDNAIFWAIKDATGDMITIYSGLPLKPLIDKVFDKVKEWKGNPHAEHYVENKLKKQIELHKKKLKSAR